MTTTRIEATRQSQHSQFRPPVRCDAGHTLSIAEQIETFCERCAAVKANQVQEGRA